MAAELLVLLPHDGSVLPVLPDDIHERRADPHRGLELLAVHQEAAVAAHRYDVAIPVHELGRDRRRHGEAHAREPVRDQDGVRLVRGEHAPDPELVEPDVRDQDVVAPERLPDLPQRARRLHREVGVVLRRLEVARHHLAQLVRAARVRHVPALLSEPGEDVVDVADQLDLGDEVVVDLRGEAVDADDRLVPAAVPVVGRVLDEVVADRDHEVGHLEAGHLVVA